MSEDGGRALQRKREKLKAAKTRKRYEVSSGSGKSSVVCGVTEEIRHHMQEEESQSTRLTLLTDRKHMYGEKTERNTRHESVLSLHASSVVSSLPKRHEVVFLH